MLDRTQSRWRWEDTAQQEQKWFLMREGIFHSQHGCYYVLHINSAEKSWSSRMSLCSLKWQAQAWLPSFLLLQLILPRFLREENMRVESSEAWGISQGLKSCNIAAESIHSSTYFTFSFILIVFPIFPRTVGHDSPSWKISPDNSVRDVNSSAQE